MRRTPGSSPLPVPVTSDGRPQRASAQLRISSWSIVTRELFVDMAHPLFPKGAPRPPRGLPVFLGGKPRASRVPDVASGPERTDRDSGEFLARACGTLTPSL